MIFSLFLLLYFFAWSGDLSSADSQSQSPQPRVSELSCFQPARPSGAWTQPWPRAVAPTQHRGGRRWRRQDLSPACYSRDTSEQGQNAALLSLNLPWSNVWLHGFMFIDLFPTGCVSNSVGCSILIAMCFDILRCCFEIPACSQFSTGISGGAF